MCKINSIKNIVVDIFKKLFFLKQEFYNIFKKKIKKKIFLFKLNNLSNNLNKKENNKEFLNIKKLTIMLKNCVKDFYDFIIFLKLSIEEGDKNFFFEIFDELHNLKNKINELELQQMFSSKKDKLNCYIDIQAGSGGVEAQDWAKMILKMYLYWAKSHNFDTKIIEEIHGDLVGIKSATVKIIGKYAYGWLRTETGIHRLVRKSPFDPINRRHTSFSSAFVYPEINDFTEIKINTYDLRVDVYRSSGAGGQHVNKTESAVRIIHLPTNIMSQCQNYRSQHKNKEQALKQLKNKLYKLEFKKKNIKKNILENNKLDINWGRQIRSYILDNSFVKDLRTGIETRNIESVLNGNLDEFIKANLKIGI